MKKNVKKKPLGLIVIGLLLIAILCLAIYFKSDNKKVKDNIKEEIKKIEDLVIDKEPEKEKKLNIIDENKNTRNVAVMINNIKAVWGYQAGIQDAYIVYEAITEGGISRLMGIFRDTNPGKIGTVRSARIYYLDYVLENDAIYVHVGGSKEALRDIKELSITDLGSSVTYRDKEVRKVKAYEHTAYTSMKLINQKISQRKLRDSAKSSPVLKYSIDEIDLSKMEESILANKVYISYSKQKDTSFEYDSKNKVYKRFQNNIPHKDYVTKKQYTVKNIITYQVKNASYDSYGRQKLYNIGTGNGYYITNGYAVPITWEKKSRSSKTIYRYKNGEEIKVNDGNTHIEIQPKSRELKIN